MKDIEVIDKFKQQISWGDEAELLQFGDRLFLTTHQSVYVPTLWSEISIVELLMIRETLNKRVVAIVWGDLSEDIALQICWRCAYADLSAQFIDVVGRIAWLQWLTHALDGINWNQSLMSIAKNNRYPKPVYEWDE
jgi:hypothetical protein